MRSLKKELMWPTSRNPERLAMTCSFQVGPAEHLADALSWMSPSKYLTGYGAESFFALSQEFFSMAGVMKWGAHSAIVQTFFELGALGLTAYLWLYFSTARMIRRLFAVKPLLALIGMCLLVANFLVSSSGNMFAYLIYN